VERIQVAGCAGTLIAALLLTLAVVSCENPFAPALRGSTESLWTDASTVGGLLQNFVTAYQLGDSLQYAALLDDQFQFRYYDVTLQRSEGWYRETELRTTSRMFRTFDNLSLIWGGLDSTDLQNSTSDTPVEIRVHYTLVLDDISPLLGFARFTLLKPAGGRFRIVLWEDEY
jgi:hypothetical protein